MFVLVLLGLLCLGYSYRNYLLIKCVMLFLFLWKIIITLRFINRNDDIKNKYIKVINNRIYDSYHIVHDNKDYDFVFVGNTNNELYKDLVEFKQNINNVILNKNMIVYAGFIKKKNTNDKLMDIEMDVTDEFRKFSFYFDKKRSIKYFLDYFYETTGIYTSDYDLVIYRNNDALDSILCDNNMNFVDLM